MFATAADVGGPPGATEQNETLACRDEIAASANVKIA